jgi:hypothetical protein
VSLVRSMKRRLDRVRRALSALLHPGERARGDVDEELHAHIEARVDYLMERGMTPEAARAEAIRRFGDLEGARTALHAHALGNRRRVHLADRLQQLAQDARYVVRGLTHSPSFSAGVVATLALGLGINAAVFEVADHVLLRPPTGVADVWSIRRVETTVGFGSGPALRSSLFSHPDARLIAESGTFAVTSTYSPPRLTPAGDGREAAVSVVDDRFFRLLGADPPVGRAFDAREAEAGARPAVAVVSFDYWQRELAAALLTDRSTIRLGERTFRIIGVAPKGFIGIDLDPVDVWLPVGDADFGGGMVNGVVIPWYRSEMLRALRVIGRPPAHNSDEVVVQQLTAVFGSADADAGRPPRQAVLHRIVPAGDPSRTEAANRLLARLSGVGHRAAHRVRQCDEPSARTRDAAASRDRDSIGHRREPGARVAAARHREHDARALRRRRGPLVRNLGRFRAAAAPVSGRAMDGERMG